MSEQFLGEIRLVSFNFAAKGWALCNGQLLPINQNQALFSLLGTSYGGNGQTNFALPNLQGALPMHMGGGFNLGEVGGEEQHTLTTNELPVHTHTMSAAPQANTANPAGGYIAASGKQAYATAPDVAMNTAAIGIAGAGEAHNNMPPFLVLNFMIALQGIFPSRN